MLRQRVWVPGLHCSICMHGSYVTGDNIVQHLPQAPSTQVVLSISIITWSLPTEAPRGSHFRPIWSCVGQWY